MKKAFILALVCVIVSPLTAYSQKRRRSAPKRSAPASRIAESPSADLQAARQRVATQIKVLSQFLYLLAGITKGIEAADQAARSRETSSAAVELNERNKTKVKESLRNVREGLDKLEADFRSNPKLNNFYARLAGVARIGATAESQAAANRFDEAGRSLLTAINQLADALAAQ